MKKSAGAVPVGAIAHRGGDSNSKEKIIRCFSQSDLGSHLAVQRFQNRGPWFIWHGKMRDEDKIRRLPWNIPYSKEIAERMKDVMTLPEAMALAHQQRKRMWLEPKVPSRLTQKDEIDHFRSFLEECDHDVVAAIVTASRRLLKSLVELNDERKELGLPTFPLGYIVDEKKMAEVEDSFSEEEQRTPEAIAHRVSIAIRTALPGNRTHINSVLLGREAALKGPDVMRLAMGNCDHLIVLTVDDPEELEQLRGYGQYAPYAVITNHPFGAQRLLSGHYDDPRHSIIIEHDAPSKPEDEC